MDSISYKTRYLHKGEFKKEWILVDATDEVVGRLCSRIAMILRGKHKAIFTPNMDCGDNVVVINADKIRFTGKKFTDKEYISHTGYPGGQRVTTPEKMIKKHPTFIIEKAIKGMLPKNHMGARIFSNLHIYLDDKHPYQAQQPKQIDLTKIK